VWKQGSVGAPWQVSMDELMDKNLPYFVGGNLATLHPSDHGFIPSFLPFIIALVKTLQCVFYGVWWLLHVTRSVRLLMGSQDFFLAELHVADVEFGEFIALKSDIRLQQFLFLTQKSGAHIGRSF